MFLALTHRLDTLPGSLFFKGRFIFELSKFILQLNTLKDIPKHIVQKKLIKWLGSHLCTFFNQLTYSLFYVINFKEE